MAETQPTQPDPKEQTPEQQAEEAYWTKFESRLDGWFEKKKGELTGGTGTSRAGGRTTLPGILANLVFGPEKKD